MSISNCCFTDGGNSGTLTYLIDNQGQTFNINGGQFFNDGTGDLLNPTGVGGVIVGAITTRPHRRRPPNTLSGRY